MATRTYQAIGLNWSTWIELAGDKGPIVLTRSDNRPHAYAASPSEALERFGAKRGVEMDRNAQQQPTFIQEFTAPVLEQIKAVSAATWAKEYPAPGELAESAG